MPLGFDPVEDAPNEKNRRWSFANGLERLKAIRQERTKLNGIEFDQVTVPQQDQQSILDLLKVKL